MHITPSALSTVTLDWGTIKWLVTPAAIADASSTFGEVIVNTSKGHDPHSHPTADEVIYVISGEGRQTVGDEAFDLKAGDAVWIPRDVMHSTYNTGWQPLRLLVTYTPGGEESGLEALPDFGTLAPGELATWRLADDA